MRRGLLPLVLGSVWIAPSALAQDRSALPPGAVVQPIGDGASNGLNRNLTALAQNPRSVEALNGAGAAALDTGDANAALNFFARALDADPSSARAKAGMAQSLVRQERASEALPLFTEAVRMGVPEAEIAADRGLAWDTLGFPTRAQADYTLALRREDDPEVRRRLALSLAITGQRAEALRVIDPQLRVNDRAGWRTQAFILALTGDAAGAGQTARQMLPGAADQLAPFFQRLASLSPSQKALAVHFGHFPSDGRAQNYAQADSIADPGALAMARGNVPMGEARSRSRTISPLEAAAVRRRPDADQATLSAQIRPAPTRTAEAAPRRQYSAPSFLEAASTGEGGPPPQRYAAAAQPGGSAPAWPTPVLDERQSAYPSRPPAPPPPPVSLTRPAPNEYQPQNNAQSPGFTLVPQGRPLGRQAIVQPQPQTSFDAVRSAVNALKEEEASEVADPVEGIAPPVRSQPVRSAPVRQAQAPAPRRQPPAQANPSRAWVQVATGSNRAGMIFTYGQFRRRAGALLNGRAPYMATNRLLVGPFPNEAAAGSFARQLSGRGVPSHSWTSDAGQRIDQLQAAASSDDSPAPTRTRTAANERSSGTRSGRDSTGSRSERNGTGSRNGRDSSRNERSAGNASGRNRNGTTSRNERSASNGSSRTRNGATSGRGGNSRNERAAGNSSRNERNGNGRNGRAGTSNSRTANAGTGRNGSSSSRNGTRNSRPTTSASTRSSRGGSGGQSRSSTRRGR